jgi:endonuclease YncB( thermonuclease family)
VHLGLRSAVCLAIAAVCGLGVHPASAAPAKTWQVLSDCAVVDNKSNDGDSFHVRWDGNEFIFRIYFADCPEDESRFPDRVAAQAAYFGITSEQALAVGRQAATFTRELMTHPFSVKTRWQKALGSSHLQRTYGFVEVEGTNDLAELLVEHGLARIHGVGVSGLTQAEVERLKAFETHAKAEKLGAWGVLQIPPIVPN